MVNFGAIHAPSDTITLYDLAGKVIIQDPWSGPESSRTLKFSYLPSGIYLLEVVCDEGRKTLKVEKR